MAKAVYVGVGSKARKMKKAYIGIGGKARKVKKMYIGDSSGKARLCYSAELEYVGTATALAVARYGVRTATVGNYALFAGGLGTVPRSSHEESVCFSTVDAYNASLTKSTPTALSTTRCSHAAATIGSYALFAGGSTKYGVSYSEITNTVDAYSTSLTRSSAAALSVARRWMGAAVVGSYALFAGGTTDSRVSGHISSENTVDVYNASLTHTTAVGLSSYRSNAKGASVGSYAIFAGGNAGNLNVDVYNSSLTRTTATTLQSGANNDAAATIGNYAIFVGDSAAADIYDTSLTRTSAAILSTARTGLAAATVGDYAVFNGRGIVDYCDASLTRSTMDTSQQGHVRYDMTGTTVGDYALFAGGCDANKSTLYHDYVEVYTA